MLPLTPKQKQALSGLVVVLGGALLTWANASLKLLPEGWQGLVGALLAGVAHYVPAAGTEAAVAEKLEGKS
jgi:hypothetical protein